MTPVRSSKPSRLILIVAMVAAPVAALAQGTGVSPTDPHRYPLPTYEEDWRALQTSDRTDVWAPVKFVRLSADVRTEMAMSALARSRRSRIPFARSAEDAIRHPSGR